MIYLDTHVVVWLYVARTDLLSDRAKDLLEKNELSISPMVLLELEYLREVGRLSVGGAAIHEELQERIGLRVCDLPFPRVVQFALRQHWTRDPFDRVIVGHAAASRKGLLTRDDKIRANFPNALW
ncbi:MAG: PIN domain-containing protein [Planctomycetes bacterium]|nr:PIN domain-containing protein [Planctomycetota bacterium]